jgi:type I restriction enzyme S subunit
MIHDLKPYLSYKDSGVPWLGEVPEHWEVVPFMRSFQEVYRYPTYYSITYVSSGVPEVRGEALANGMILTLPDQRYISEATNQRYSRTILCKGDLIMSVRGTMGKIGVVGPEHAGGNITANLLKMAPRKELAESQYLSWLLRSAGFLRELDRWSPQTTIKTITMPQLSAIRLCAPSLDEQSAIVRFLDYMDRSIRRYIHAKKKLIELLNEQKQAIIHRAVTRGLDPDFRLKPSGVEWLGDVPEHWEVRPAKHFYREVDERSATGAEELLSVSHITGVTPRSQKNITMFMASSYVGHKLCRPGDLVINTMWAWMAALGVAKQMGIVSPSYGVYRPLQASKLLSQYADLLLRTKPYVSEYVCRSTGIRSSRLRLYPEQFLRIKLVCPSAEEQKAILERVTVETAASDRAIASAQREIDLLREYRARLIADVVTGKLDVREAAARLPDEAEEPEPLDDADALAEGNEEAESANLDAAPEEAEA